MQKKQDGKLANFVQIKVDNDNLQVRLIKRLNTKLYIPLTDKVSIDVGLNPLFATDKGDLLGRKFFNALVEFDRKIVNRVKYLQSIGVKRLRTDRKYTNLINHFRDYLKNEINRLLNRLLIIYRPKIIVIEKLDFRNTELSKRLNRLLSNFGKKFIKEKLNRFKELYGVEIIHVNPTYTSQECSVCGYVDERNRKNTQEFVCRACGKKLNAQVNGARVIGKRSSLTCIKPYHSKKYVLKVLVNRYLERFKGCNSAPLEVFRKNRYFKGYLENFLNPVVVGNK